MAATADARTAATSARTPARLALAAEILAPDCVLHVNGQELRGLDAAKQVASAIQTAFPDAQITHHDAIVAGNRVAIRWTSDATHQGEYVGVPASGKRVHIEGLDWFHLQGGKIAEVWIEYDNLSVLHQMGAIPVPGQAAAAADQDQTT